MPAKGQEHSMSTSIFLAKLIGPVCLVIGLALLINGAAFRTLAGEFLNNPALMFLSGAITLPGWLPTVGGPPRILVPQRAAAVGRTLVANPSALPISTGIYLVFGALLSFF